jgi:predicted ABC-type ATPase
MAESSPNVVVLAGPNGAGKSTSAPSILKDALGVDEFVNADAIAQGLSGFAPERAGLAAGRIMLARLRELARQRSSSLASRSFAPWIADLMRTGYQFHLVFLWLPHPDIAVARVAARVRTGGHDVPEETIRRRYEAGQSNFFRLYQPMATTWEFWDNSTESGLTPIASGSKILSGISDSEIRSSFGATGRLSGSRPRRS